MGRIVSSRSVLVIATCVAILAVVAVGCSALMDSGVTVNFGNEVQKEQNLMFTFNDRMVPDSLVQRWDTTELIRFSPHVHGKVKWVSPTQLVFSPSTGFAAATQYTAELTDEVTTYAQGAALPTDKKFSFHTPYQSIIRTSAQWVKNATTNAEEVRVTLQFTYSVNPTEVGQRMSVMFDGAALPYALDGAIVDKQVLFTVPASSFASSDSPGFVITIAKGLPIAEEGLGANSATTTLLTATVQVPSKNTLEISDVRSSFQGTQGVIDIYTSQAIDPASLDSAFTFYPSVQFSASTTPQGVRIVGTFPADNTIQMTVRTSLRGQVGGRLSDEVYREVTFGEMQPGIAFTAGKAMYMGSRGNRALGISIVNVPEVRVTVFRVYENNILHFLREARRYAWYSEDEVGAQYDFSYMGLSDYADTVTTRIYKSTEIGTTANGVGALTLDVHNHATRPGMYLVKVESTEDQWIQASRLVALSDVGLIVKESRNGVMVFANSIKDATPLSNVDINLISTNNQVIQTIRTNAEGIATLSDKKAAFRQFRLGMVTARQNDDYTFLVMKDTRVDASRFEVGGLGENSSGLQAFMYGDRDMYRPGETVHVATIVRDEQWKPAANIPVKFRVILPTGKEFRTMRATLNEQGATAIDVPIPAASLTGTFVVEVYTATDVLLASHDVGVEEFMPDRIKVTLGMAHSELLPGIAAPLSISGSYFFGPPAANRNYQITTRIQKSPFTPKTFKNFNFNVTTKNESQIYQQIENSGVLSAEGRAEEKIVIDSALRGTGLLSAKMFVSVFDESGRPVHRFEQRKVLTQPALFGVKRFDRYASIGKNIDAVIVACTPDGKTTAAQARVQIVRTEWHTVMERDYSGHYRYVSQRREIVMADRTIQVNGSETRFPFAPTMSGDYEIRVSMPGSESFVSHDFWAWGEGATTAASFEVNTEGTIDIETDKEIYQPGEKANILFKTPFSGKMLITVERNDVIEHHVVQTDKRSATLTLPVGENWLPNVYITATLFKPHGASDMPLTVAHGYAAVSVHKPSNKLNVSISAATAVRSQQKETITVQAPPGSQVTIAVVDEGILSVRGMQTPDPFGYFYQKRALGVESYNMYPFLYPELRIGQEAYGAGEGIERRLNPFTAKRVNLISYWSGITSVSAGSTKFTIDIPQFSGALRVMAVAWNGASFGSAEKTITVADPLVVSTPMPRVMAPADTIQVPVMISNTTKNTAAITATLATSGPVKVVGNSSRALTVEAGYEGVAMFTIAAEKSFGVATVTATASGLSEKFQQVTEISVRPINPLVEESSNGVVAAGASEKIAIANTFIGNTKKARLLVTSFPAVQITKNLNQLIGYPYGCVEQTISKAFPQIYIADLFKAWQQTDKQHSDPARYVQEAVRKIETMQTGSGGVSYWPGGSQVTWWGTAYAAHFLGEAKRVGYDVNGVVLDRMLQYLERKAKGKELEDVRYYGGDGASFVKQVPARDIFYSLFVLASMGRQDIATMNYYKSSLSNVPQDGRYMLACTYLMLGDSKSYSTILPKDFQAENFKPLHNGSFASPTRDMALALYALVATAPNDAQTARLAQRLSSTMSGRDIYSTQENAFALLALGKLANRSVKAGATATIKANGKVLGTTQGGSLSVDVSDVTECTVQSSNGTMYYFWSAEGIKGLEPTKPEDKTLKVRRAFFTRDGKPLTISSTKQNDVIVVKVTVSTMDKSTVRNVVVSDVLPAGWELENPRLGAFGDVAWAKDGSIAEYYDYRDDRMNLFVSAEPTEKAFYYVVRAVTKGTFTMGPIGADAMYDDDVHSYSGGGKITVL